MRVFEQSALIVDDLFRYTLIRRWHKDAPLLVVCMCNPSTANANVDDPTVLALMHFAYAWGFGGILIVNEHAFRASRPSKLKEALDPNGPDNWRHMHRACDYAADTSGIALVAWGNLTNGKTFQKYARRHGLRLVCLGTTQNGSPKHPMARGVHRIPRDQQPIDWRA